VGSDLELALELADAADRVTLPRFRAADLVVETKPDTTYVSEADKAAEQAIRDVLARAQPDDGVLGEEFGESGSGHRRWVIDPIDGTSNYVRGIPVWATLIALQEDDDLTVGVVSAPALGRRWWAAIGEGAFADDQRIQVSKVAAVEDAHFSYSVSQHFPDELTAALHDLSARAWRGRGFGDFWPLVLVAEGAVDISIEPGYFWDLAPLQVIVEEAGGRFTDLRGRRRADAGVGLSTNGLLHDAVLAAITPATSR
jgi:histidinol-phosphatase